MVQHRLKLGVAAVSLAFVAGCGGGTSSTSASPSSTLAGRSAEQVLAASKKALAEAKSVRYRVDGKGDAADPKSTLTIDVRIAKGKGATGSMSIGGQEMTILQVGSDSYLSADSPFLTSMGMPASSEKGKWIKSPPQAGGLIAITDIAKSFDALNTNGATLSLGTPKTVDGRQTVAVVVAPKGDQDGGTLYVAADGPAYPLLIETKGKAQGTLTFTEYDEPVEITAPSPASVIELPRP